VGLVLLARPLIHVVFGWGAFNPEDVQLTADTLRWYATGYVAFALEIVLLQFFYAARQTLRPTYIGIITSLVQLHILTALITLDGGSVGAFTLAFSISKAVKVIALLALLALVYPHLKLWMLMLKRTGSAFLKIVLVTAVMGAVVYGVDLAFGRLGLSSRLLSAAALCATVCIGGLIFVAGVHLAGVEEWRQALGGVKGKLKR